MADVTLKRVEELEAYAGEHAVPSIQFRSAAKPMGVTAWGMAVIDLAPHCTDYPEHDHAKDGQEEVYVLLRGSATLHCGSESWPVSQGAIIRVGATTKRKFVTGPEGASLLALGGIPGKPFPAKP